MAGSKGVLLTSGWGGEGPRTPVPVPHDHIRFQEHRAVGSGRHVLAGKGHGPGFHLGHVGRLARADQPARAGERGGVGGGLKIVLQHPDVAHVEDQGGDAEKHHHHQDDDAPHGARRVQRARRLHDAVAKSAGRCDELGHYGRHQRLWNGNSEPGEYPRARIGDGHEPEQLEAVGAQHAGRVSQLQVRRPIMNLMRAADVEMNVEWARVPALS